MKQISEVTCLEVKPNDVQTFRDFLEIVDENGFTDDAIFNLMVAIASKKNVAKDDNSIYANITYVD